MTRMYLIAGKKLLTVQIFFDKSHFFAHLVSTLTMREDGRKGKKEGRREGGRREGWKSANKWKETGREGKKESPELAPETMAEEERQILSLSQSTISHIIILYLLSVNLLSMINS